MILFSRCMSWRRRSIQKVFGDRLSNPGTCMNGTGAPDASYTQPNDISKLLFYLGPAARTKGRTWSFLPGTDALRGSSPQQEVEGQVSINKTDQSDDPVYSKAKFPLTKNALSSSRPPFPNRCRASCDIDKDYSSVMSLASHCCLPAH